MLTDKQLMGKRARAAGGRFERKVREDLENKGWVVDKWTNNVEFNMEHQGNAIQEIPDEVKIGKLVKAKSNRFRMSSTGFPDFAIMKRVQDSSFYFGWAVECKVGKYLDAAEKEKCKWLLENKIFEKIFIASRGEKGKIKYTEFK